MRLSPAIQVFWVDKLDQVLVHCRTAYLQDGRSLGAQSAGQELAAGDDAELHDDLPGGEITYGPRRPDPPGLEPGVAQRRGQRRPRSRHGEDRQVADQPGTRDRVQ
jgi:hypothetical protein